MIHRHYSFLILLVFICLCVSAAKAADDLTLLGEMDALSYLKEAVGTQIKTSENVFARLEIQDGAVLKDRILIRFVIRDLPPDFEKRVKDETRLYGDYLPVAEVGTPQGNWFTPSSASRYSLVSDGGQLLIAGLLEFQTEDQPKVISFDFNQIPFDLSPLSEGAVLQLDFVEEDILKRVPANDLSFSYDGLVFSLRSSAQTPTLTMIQPAVRMEREDESLSQFGWITVHRESDRGQYAVTRGTLYGFNLADDVTYAPAHAYIFSAVDGSSALSVSMDYAYVTRRAEKEFSVSKTALPVDLSLTDFPLSLTDFEYIELDDGSGEVPTLRLYFEADPVIGSLLISQPDSIYETYPSVCGFADGDDRLICDITVSEFPRETTLRLHSVEYKKEGPWEVRWQPLDIQTAEMDQGSTSETQVYLNEPTGTTNNELGALVKGFDHISERFSQREGWILKREEIKGFSADGLISHILQDVQLSHSIQEIYTHINKDGFSDQSIVLSYRPDGELITGTWSLQDGRDVVLPQALLVQTNTMGPWVTDFSYGQEYRAVIDSGAVYGGKESVDGLDLYHFSQSLIGDPEEDPNAQIIRYYADPKSGEICRSEIECNIGGSRHLCVSKTIDPLTYASELPDWLKNMTENILF